MTDTKAKLMEQAAEMVKDDYAPGGKLSLDDDSPTICATRLDHSRTAGLEVATVAEVTAVVRASDAGFEQSGGSSRHWVIDQFLPRLDDAGFAVVRIEAPAAAPGPRPVVITHPGCNVTPLRCWTCIHRDENELCSCGVGSLAVPEYVSPQFGCACWRCRKCGGEVTT